MRCEHVPGTIDGLDDLGILRVGFQSAAQAFGHRELITEFHKRGYCSLPA